ncbi:MAG: HlyD family secretion protein [Rhodospirillales bacterium]|nr:HlyD family secretion protein [Rhodospirillales bacterium]
MSDAATAESGARASRAGTLSPIARRARMLKLRYGLFGLGAVVLVAGAGWYWLSGGRYVETDDAYVQANVLAVTTDVSGLVRSIAVHEGERVAAGQVLFAIDPTPFRLAVDQARANLAQTELDLTSLAADYRRAERQVAAQRAQVDADRATFARLSALVASRAAARQQYDDARFKLAADRAALGAGAAQAQATLARLGGSVGTPVASMPAYKLAAARLAMAERDLRHATVRARFAGVVTQVAKLQPGQYLGAGTPAFGLVETADMWVAAQPKETELTWARPGQRARVTIDAYPGHVWHGVLASVAPATDQQFSILPAQNSSGNWVKVVQRVPLRIEIRQGKDDPPLAAGMSAEVRIDTGHRRHLGDLF